MIPEILREDYTDGELVYFLTVSNDNGATFNEIADWIEENL